MQARPFRTCPCMKYLLILLLVAASMLLPSPSARGQTGPTPTPVPTDTPLPPAKDILQQAYAAQAARGSVHYQEVVKFSTPKVSRETDKTHGDISWRDALMREYTTATVTNLTKKPNKTRVTHSTLLAAEGRLASRTGKQKWDCSYLTFPTSGSGSGSGSGEDLSAIFNTASFTQANLGPETLNGIPVWHIRETMTIPGVTPKGQPGTGDYYISQSDVVPLREVVSLTMNMVDPGSASGRMKIIQHSTQDYSQYGETFSVTIPAACSTQKARAAGVPAGPQESPLLAAATIAQRRVPQ